MKDVFGESGFETKTRSNLYFSVDWMLIVDDPFRGTSIKDKDHFGIIVQLLTRSN